jgi:murein DD-endopeptidase MepM/ murein hydrolase activator NlpD
MTNGRNIFYFTLFFLLLSCNLYCLYYDPISGQNNVFTDITSTFGPRNEPASAYKFHNGIDYRTYQYSSADNAQEAMIGGG